MTSDGYFVKVSPFEGTHGVYDPQGLLIAVFPNLDAAIRRCRWLNSPLREKVAKRG